jgi:hypothetical protein
VTVFRKGMTHEEHLYESGRIDPKTGEVLPPAPDAPNVFTTNLVRRPTQKQLALYAHVRARLCGQCKFFSKDHGQKILFKEKKLAEIVHDFKWKADHLGSDPREMGACMARDLLTGPTHSGAECEQFRWKDGTR